MRFHDLRHTAATLLLRAGVDARRSSTGSVERMSGRRQASTATCSSTLRDAVNLFGKARPPAPRPDSLSLPAFLLTRPSEFAKEAVRPVEFTLDTPASVSARPGGHEPPAFGFAAGQNQLVPHCTPLQSADNSTEGKSGSRPKDAERSKD